MGGQPVDTFEQNVFIIESPSPSDVFEGRREGDALQQALILAEINCHYFNVVNREMLTRNRKRGQECSVEKLHLERSNMRLNVRASNQASRH
jgi:hypothetical protein